MASNSTVPTRPDIVYILPHRIQRRRLEDMKNAAKKKKLDVAEHFGSHVTHVVAEAETRDQVVQCLRGEDEDAIDSVEIVKLSWFTECLKKGRIVPVIGQFVLRESRSAVPQEQDETSTQTHTEFPEWACQRRTCLKHQNEKFTKAFEILQVCAEFTDREKDYSRALAFRRASCVLKSLPYAVTNMTEIQGLKDIGNSCRCVIRDILEEGYCPEVEETVIDPWFQKMKLFTSVFGVGPSTAKKWIESGWSSIEEAQKMSNSKDWRVQWGLAYHSDLTDPVSRQEAETLTSIVRSEAEKILPGVMVQLTGGFRRGKPNGHDIDLLFTHPQEGKEVGFLPRLLKHLEKQDLILCGKQEKSTYTDDVLTKDSKLSTRGQLDHFEKWLGIVKLPKNCQNITQNSEIRPNNFVSNSKMSALNKVDESLDEYEPLSKKQKCENQIPLKPESGLPQDWKARRVDLIVSPYSQYYYALVGWTGSKHFNRDLRLYVQRVLQMKLTSHGLYDYSKEKSIPAKSEKEVFDNLKLPCFDPTERNC